MRRLAMAILLFTLTSPAQTSPLQPALQPVADAASAPAKSSILIPPGTTVALELTNPILARTAKVGDSVYAETVFPVAVNNQMAIPLGTYVLGQIDMLTRPGWLSPHAQFQMHFTKFIFAGGYTVELPGSQNLGTGQPGAPASDVIAAVANAYVLVSSASDVLLDNGTQIEMVLQVPLLLNAANVAAAGRQANSRPPAQPKSATRCKPIPGSPGSPDTVIPGTPGTPPIVIPGGPGMPDTVIPGTPGTTGTPPTTLPGSPGIPYILCPGPPIVTSYLKAQD